MDYNDNDFQSQNFQLGGEDNSKFPPGLQSYALPKFDLDEHLQVDLRFDDLADAEVLLGIQNQEENHWIEDFSQGSSGIEFSSGATESRSISMRNNVWSEATSSESVEMLLKSVGQDEMITEQSIIEESDASDVLDGLNNQMDPNLNQDDSLPSNLGDIISTDPTLPPDKIMKNPSVSSDDMTVIGNCVECVPHTHKDEKTGYENLIDLDPSSVGEGYANVLIKECSLDTNASLGKNAQQIHTSAAFEVAVCCPDNTAFEGMEVDPSATSVGNPVMVAGECNNQKLQNQATDECSELVCEKPGDLIQNDAQKEEGQFLSKDIQVGDQNSVAKAVESCTEDLFSEKGNNLLAIDTSQLGTEVLSKDDEMTDCCTGNTQDSSLLGTWKKQNIKDELADSSNNDVGDHTNSAVKVRSQTDIVNDTKETVDVVDVHDSLGVNSSEYTSQNVEIVATAKKMAVKVTEGDISSPDVASNVSGNAIPEKVHCTRDLLDVNNADLHISSSLHAKSTNIFAIVSSGVLVHSDDPIVEKENKRLSNNSHNINAEVNGSDIKEKRVDSAAYEQSDATVVTDEVHGPPSVQNVGGESVSTRDALGEDTELTRFDQLEKTNLVKNEVSERKEVEKLSSNFTDTDKEETVTGISTKPCSSIIKENPNTPSCSRLVLHSDSCPSTNYNRSEKPPSEPDAESSASGEKSADAACQNESQASIALTSALESSQTLEVHPIFHAVVTDGSGASETPKNDEAMVLPVIGDAPSCLDYSLSGAVSSSENIAPGSQEAGSGSPNTIEPNCGSPTVISCTEHLQNEKEPHEGGDQDSLPQNGTVSDDQPGTSSHIDSQVEQVKSTAHDPKEKDASDDDRSFTFEVSSLTELSERESEKGWKPFANIQPFKLPQSGEGPPTSSGSCQTDPEVLSKSPLGSFQASDAHKILVTKSTGKDKTRSASGSATERGSCKQRKSAKETSYPKQTIERDSRPCVLSANLAGPASSSMQVEETRQYAYNGGSGTMSAVQTVQTHGLPDLNSSASSITLFRQPFTDLQQVQLRAQIFVYGSLIQGTAPDEACMISAFGDSSRDGGKSMWENVWRTAVERVHNQRLPLSNLDTPVHSRSGVRVPDRAPKASPLQMKAHGSPATRTSSKGAPSSVANPLMSLSSPLWSISTPRDGLQSGVMPRSPFLDPHQSLSPLHPYRSPHSQQHVGSSTPWFTPVSSPAPWFVSPQTSAGDAAAQYSALPVVEAVQVTSVRDLSGKRASNMQLTPHRLSPTEVPLSVPVGTATLMEGNKTSSVDQKSRKRKKSLVSQERGDQISLITQPQTKPSSIIGITGQLTTSVGISSPANPLGRSVEGSTVSNSSPVASSTWNRILGGSDTDQRVVVTEETFSKIEKAKLHAEDAAAMAASAIRHSQGIWSQLSIQKNSGLVSEVEAALTSAAVAAAAAASVAKAAAAAAKVASEAALQAKLMADEAMTLPKLGNSAQGSESSLPDSGANLGVITPALILKGKDKTNSSSSVIVAAREAARKRVETAAAAAKRAENLDAVVKAAELAVEAVSQAGAVVAMGDPIPLSLSELIEAGPEGNWKVHQASSEQIVKANNTHRGEQSGIDGAEQLSHTNEVEGTVKEGNTSSPKDRQLVENIPALRELSKDSVVNEKGHGVRRGRKTSHVAKTIAIPTETVSALREASATSQIDEYERHQQEGTDKENNIKEGSHVEVTSDEVGLRGLWFSAKVLSLKDGHAHVYYSELLQDEVRVQLKEWIPLEGEGNKAPKIRIAHPMTAVKFEGTRKRRRAVIGNYVWSVGDQVDALVRDGWREGIVIEKAKEDETKLTIHFSAEGDSSVVRAWNLRPSLIWKDGQWIEWSRENNGQLYEHDTPKEKRQKGDGHEDVVDSHVDASRKDKLLGNLHENSRKSEESRPLMLSAKDTVFSVGKSTVGENNSDAPRIMQTGLQKEGSRVVFGVPKPGKKRKFMEVSKHLVSDQAARTGTSEGTDPIKVSKYLMPQGTYGWKNAPKVDIKGKQAAMSKPKVIKSGKAQSIQNRTKPEKNGSLTSVVPVSGNGIGQDPLRSSRASSMSHEENVSHCNTLKGAEDPVLLSSLVPGSDVPPSRRKPSTANEAEWGLKGKLIPASENILQNEEKGLSLNENLGKSISDVVEPRRSNRRIQPTSRLLEGLQSSLIITKLPSVSHDKSIKTQNRSTSSSRGNSRARGVGQSFPRKPGD